MILDNETLLRSVKLTCKQFHRIISKEFVLKQLIKKDVDMDPQLYKLANRAHAYILFYDFMYGLCEQDKYTEDLYHESYYDYFSSKAADQLKAWTLVFYPNNETDKWRQYRKKSSIWYWGRLISKIMHQIATPLYFMIKDDIYLVMKTAKHYLSKIVPGITLLCIIPQTIQLSQAMIGPTSFRKAHLTDMKHVMKIGQYVFKDGSCLDIAFYSDPPLADMLYPYAKVLFFDPPSSFYKTIRTIPPEKCIVFGLHNVPNLDFKEDPHPWYRNPTYCYCSHDMLPSDEKLFKI